MAAAQHRPQKPNMFRRMLSPRDHKGKQEKARASTMSEVNGHRRDDHLQGSMEIENTEYRDPEHLHQQFPPPSRTQSLVYPSTSSDSSAPGLPPRNTRPISFNSHPLQRKQSNDPDESALYVEPANTLRRDPSSITSNYTQVEPSKDAVPTKQDLKQMTMYKQTMEQKQGGGHRRVRSFGHVIDNSEYSTPFDLLEENERARQRGEAILPASVRATLSHPQRSASDKPPPKPPHVRRTIRQVEHSSDSDARIPVVSPTPPTFSLSDRSHTSSPSSPHSAHSSEQEPIRDDGTNDYDEPWDKKFKDLPRMRSTTKSEGHLDSRVPPHRHSHTHLSDRTSPPSPGPLERPNRPYRDKDRASISPEIPTDRHMGFIKGGPGRNSGRREGSSSPLPPVVRDGRSFSTPHPPHHHHSHHRFDQAEPGSRTSSVSMAGRLLPPTPTEINERRILAREVSPPPAIIDVSIPLEDQPWYHGSITRAQAEAILADQPDFSFIVRKSESSNTNFSLSIRDYASGFIHLRMILESGPTPGYVLGQFSGNFNTVQECISFYTKQKLNIRGAEHKKLGLPIPRANNVAKYRM